MLRTCLSKLNITIRVSAITNIKKKFEINLNNSFKFLNTSQMSCSYEKKSGVFEEHSKITTTQINKPKVKLYPGYQESYEEKIIKKSNDIEETYAKKVIEDFYGLNELEFDKDKADMEMKEMEENIELEFDLNYIVKILNDEKIKDICCIQLPEDISYTNYLITGTCFSEKHLNSSFMTINRKYKKTSDAANMYLKKTKLGKEQKWCAIDVGKVVIHLFLPEYRDYYNLESLWSCGIEHDEKFIEFVEEKKEMERKLTLVEEEKKV